MTNTLILCLLIPIALYYTILLSSMFAYLYDKLKTKYDEFKHDRHIKQQETGFKKLLKIEPTDDMIQTVTNKLQPYLYGNLFKVTLEFIQDDKTPETCHIIWRVYAEAYADHKKLYLTHKFAEFKNDWWNQNMDSNLYKLELVTDSCWVRPGEIIVASLMAS